jgi:hypothetical protein
VKHIETATIVTPLSGLNIRENPPLPVVITSGTAVTVVAHKFEWLGNEGLYSDVVVDELPGYRFRVRAHHLNQALGRIGLAGVLKSTSALA